MRFVHTADLQLGARFARFGSVAQRLRSARMETLGRIVELAVSERADGLIIAGDLFEDNGVDPGIVEQAFTLLVANPELSVFVLPGNHDPATGPSSIWNRRPFVSPPPHLHILTEAGTYRLGDDGVVLASPLNQKRSSMDPSSALEPLVKNLDGSGALIKIGVTHGSLQIAGKFQPDDHPIALDAASRLGLDYLAVGHWHSWGEYDRGQLVMPGTPEPDGFGRADAGSVAVVEITAPGQAPEIQKVPVGTLQWEELEIDAVDLEGGTRILDAELERLRARAERIVLRVRIQGMFERGRRKDLDTWLAPKLEGFPLLQVVDQTRSAPAGQGPTELGKQHPVVAEVVDDLAKLRATAMAEGTVEGSGYPVQVAQELLGLCPLAIEEIDQQFFATAEEFVRQGIAGWQGGRAP